MKERQLESVALELLYFGDVWTSPCTRPFSVFVSDALTLGIFIHSWQPRLGAFTLRVPAAR